MASVRYSKIIAQPERVLAAIEHCRAVMIDASTNVRPHSLAYHAVHMVTAAIDARATFIPGERHYFAMRYRGEEIRQMAASGFDLDESPYPMPEEFARSRPPK